LLASKQGVRVSMFACKNFRFLQYHLKIKLLQMFISKIAIIQQTKAKYKVGINTSLP